MKTYVGRWLPAIVQNRTNAALLGIAAAAIIGGAIASPAPHASMASNNIAAVATPANGPAAPANGTANAAAQATAAKPATPPPAQVWLGPDVRVQPNYYYCGPAATRIALSMHGKAESFDALANKLGTTPAGTSSAYDITRVLNGELGAGRYTTTEIPNKSATRKQIDQLQADVVATLNRGDTVVANIAGTVTDSVGGVHSYEGGHYLDIIGYTDHGKTVVIGDPADPAGDHKYMLSTTTMANWIATRGYSH